MTVAFWLVSLLLCLLHLELLPFDTDLTSYSPHPRFSLLSAAQFWSKMMPDNNPNRLAYSTFLSKLSNPRTVEVDAER